MNIDLSDMVKRVFKLGIILSIACLFTVNIKNNELKSSNINIRKTIELEHRYVNFQTIERKNNSFPLFYSKILNKGEAGIIATTPDGNENIIIKQPVNQVVSVGVGNPQSFTGTMTGYGPDCVGCGGKVSCQPRQNVLNGNIYYSDSNYDRLRIIAADSNIPCGTIVQISNTIQSTEPIMAIVLDRGGAIKGKKIDLLFASEKEAGPTERDVKFDILRWGW